MVRRKSSSRRRGRGAPWHKKGSKRRVGTGNGRESHHKESAWIRVGAAKIREDDVISFIFQNDGEAPLAAITTALLGSAESKYGRDLELMLKNLCYSGNLRFHGDVYTLQRDDDLFVGELTVLPRGFAFLAVERGGRKSKIPEKDIFVPASALGSAMQGDRVLVRTADSRRGRVEGRVIKVLSRSSSTLVGIYMAGKPTALVTPEDKRFTFNVLVDKTASRGAKNGEAVVVEITEFLEGQRNHAGRVIEVLGDPQSLAVQTEIVIRKYDLPHEFSSKVVNQAARLNADVDTDQDRLDLRKILHVTIDGETARDFDDAVAIDKLRDGYRLYVSIADVSHYVQPGTALDQEAYERGTSIYFPNRVVPMLPERLSNNLCSLVPNEDRLAFTAIIDFDKDGKRREKKFSKSIIRSHHRLTYNIVKEILVDRDQERRCEYKAILTPLKWMAELGGCLEKQRMQRGSIGFELPEAFIKISDDDTIEDITRTERNLAHKLIEEFMLAANEAVAATFTARQDEDVDFLYRVHETPDPVKVEEFSKFAASLGIKTPDGTGTPQWFGKVLAMVAGGPYEYIVSNLLLRTMKQAHYQPENVGHFGLAAADYCHFTSPIRRYPDLIVHRALQEYVSRQKEKGQKQYADSEEAGVFLSKRERVAVEAEREMIQRLMARFMSDKIGESFAGIISGVTSFGMFIELRDSFVSGAVPIIDMTDDYYNLDEKNHRLTGKISGKTYQLGGQIMVKVGSVDLAQNRINFIVDVEPGDAQDE